MLRVHVRASVSHTAAIYYLKQFASVHCILEIFFYFRCGNAYLRRPMNDYRRLLQLREMG